MAIATRTSRPGTRRSPLGRRPSLLTRLGGPALLGAATGLRSQIGLAGLVLGGDRALLPARLRSDPARRAVLVAAAGELVADKYPKAPSRTAPPSLLVRLGLGGTVGALAARRAGCGLAAGAATGAVTAGATSFAGLAGRTRLSRLVPPLVAALVEDAVATGLVAIAVRRVLR